MRELKLKQIMVVEGIETRPTLRKFSMSVALPMIFILHFGHSGRFIFDLELMKNIFRCVLNSRSLLILGLYYESVQRKKQFFFTKNPVKKN